MELLSTTHQFVTLFLIDVYVECEFKSKQLATKELETMQFLYKLVKKLAFILILDMGLEASWNLNWIVYNE